MIVTEYRIPYALGQTIPIKQITDVHDGNTHCDIASYKRFLDGESYYIGTGDIFDAIVVPDKRYSKGSDISPETDFIDEAIERQCDLLAPHRDRIIGLGLGNHESVALDRCGTNMIKRLCKRLGVPYLGYSGLLKLVFSENNSRTRTVKVRYHHGWGGGSRTTGGDLTKFSKDMAYWDADLFLYGHVHQLKVDVIPRLGISGTRLIAKPKTMVIGGTFLKTYSDTTDPTYSEIKGYPPVPIGGAKINIKPNKNWVSVSTDLELC